MDEPGVLLMRRVICRLLLARIVILLSLPAMYMARFSCIMESETWIEEITEIYICQQRRLLCTHMKKF